MAIASTQDSETHRPGFAGARDYFALLKPRVMSLVLFTAIVGLIAAPGSPDPVLSVVALLAIAVGAGASGALNMWYDADIDRLMNRTKDRPLPAGRIQPEEAATFGVVLSLLSVLTMALIGAYLAAGLLAFTIFFYAVVYTMWLKRSTAQNIVIGGAAGALPPVIGWAAATGEAGFAPWTLFLIIFLWTPPHFWALALCRSEEYERASVPMLPTVAGSKNTRLQIFLYSLALVASSFLPMAFGLGSYLYLTAVSVLGAIFIGVAGEVLRARPDTERAKAMRLFAFSIFYLFGLFLALLIEALSGLSPMFAG